MAKTIAFPVGRGGMNLPEDVGVVWEMLQGVGESVGGLQGPNSPSSSDLNALNAAIERFQQTQKIIPANGLITKESPTLFKLSQFYDQSAGDGTAAAQYIAGMRDRVCALARTNCGKVSDQITANGVVIGDYIKSIKQNRRAHPELNVNGNWKDLRHGGDFLKRLFDDILFHPINWRDEKTYPFNSKFLGRFEITNLDGVYKRNMRVPLRNAEEGGTHWCGKVATWIWRQAGIDIKWRSDLWPQRPMIGGNFLDTRLDKRNIKHGDIAVVPEQSHHFIIMTDPESTADSYLLQTVDGNDEYQEIREHNGGIYPKNHTMKKICAYYSLEDAFANLTDRKGIKKPKYG